MSYDPSYNHGRAEYSSWMELKATDIQTLTASESDESIPFEQRRYAKVVYSINAGSTSGSSNTVVLSGSLPSGNNQIGRFGYTLKKLSTNFYRPADTVQYAIGDCISTATSGTASGFTFDLSSVGVTNGQSIEIRKLAVISNLKPPTLPLVNVYLSNTSFTITLDNLPLDIDDTTIENGGAWFSCDNQNYTASNSSAVYASNPVPMVLANNDSKLYGAIQTTNAYSPGSNEKFTIIIWFALL